MIVEPRVIPTLLLQSEKFVKTTQFSNPIYVGDPVNVLSIFNEFEVDEIVILDIQAAKTRTPTPVDQLRKYAEECFIPLAYGGGLTTTEELSRLFNAGYEKAVLNSSIFEDPAFVQSATSTFGSQAIVASIDVAVNTGGKSVMIHGGTKRIAYSPIDWAKQAAEYGVGEILLTSIDREGTGKGYDLELIAEVQEAVDLPVIAHGGAGSRGDLTKPVLVAGASASAAGQLFLFQALGRGVLINYPSRTQIRTLFGPSAVGC